MLTNLVQHPFDLHQAFSLFGAEIDADALERLGPKLTDLSVTPFKGGIHSVSK